MVGHQHIGMQAYSVARQAILQQVSELKKGIAFGDELGDAPEEQP